MKQKAAKGDGEALFSLGHFLVQEADGKEGLLGANGRSPMADVGLALSTCTFRVAHRTEMRRRVHLSR